MRKIGLATDLRLPSLYYHVDNKHALLTRYLNRRPNGGMRPRTRRQEAPAPPRAAIARFLEDIMARSLAAPHGCFLGNPVPEMAPHDEAVRATIGARLAELEDVFLRMLWPDRGSRTAVGGDRDGMRVLARLRLDADVPRGRE